MNTVCPIDKCNGCHACVSVCPKNAISISEDIRSYNAVIDEAKCINCQACHRVCPVEHHPDKVKNVECLQGWCLDEKIRAASSSGGLASALAYSFIKEGGKVCSCVFENGRFVFEIIDSVDRIDRFQGSKYVKSNPDGVYLKVKEDLTKGEKVLFIGLPCQVDGLLHFLPSKLTNNLFTVDLICHGTPAPQLISRFLLENGLSIKTIPNLFFRRKNKFGIEIKDFTGRLHGDFIVDKYMLAFLYGISYTENCYACQYADVKRVSDITLGDAWGSELPKIERQRGISLALVQSEKGAKLLRNSNVYLEPFSLERAIQHNGQLQAPVSKTVAREKFFSKLEKGCCLNKAVWSALPQACLIQEMKNLCIKLGIYKMIKQCVS